MVTQFKIERVAMVPFLSLYASASDMSNLHLLDLIINPSFYASRHPISYYNANKGSNLWGKVCLKCISNLAKYLHGPPFLQVLTQYLFPVVAVSIATNIPRCLEMMQSHDNSVSGVERSAEKDAGNGFRVTDEPHRIEFRRFVESVFPFIGRSTQRKPAWNTATSALTKITSCGIKTSPNYCSLASPTIDWLNVF